MTNQSGIGRGLITEAQYRAVQEELLRQIGEGGSMRRISVRMLRACRRRGASRSPGWCLEAAADFDIDLGASYFDWRQGADIECGRRAGARRFW